MNEWRLIIFKRFVQSHGVGQWHSQNVHLTPVPLLVGHTGRAGRGDVCPCEVHAAGGASRGWGSGKSWHGLLGPREKGGDRKTHQHSDHRGTKSRVKYSQFC